MSTLVRQLKTDAGYALNENISRTQRFTLLYPEREVTSTP